MNDEPPVQTQPSGLGPPADFATFMRKYQDMVFTTSARLVRNDAQAEDIAQEVFIKAHEHFEMLSTSPAAGGWLKTVATNLSINHLQRYRNRWKFFSEFGGGSAPRATTRPLVDFAAPDTFFEGSTRRSGAPGSTRPSPSCPTTSASRWCFTISRTSL
jgi:RNA polymerase sigma-70 factor, ECF subfamily